MMFRNAVIVILAVTTAMAQGTPPVPTVPGSAGVMQRHGVAGRRGLSGNPTRGLATPTPLRQRVQDMERTLTEMHVVLKKMQDKTAKSKTNDSLAKANLGMWELMVGHLEKELQELKIAMAAREDMEARRAALYKQADAKADAEAQAARAAEAARFGAQAPTPVSGAEGAVQSPAGQTEATQAPAAQTPSPAAAPASPATSTPSPN
jgi:hypothetical protein